jgi:hypothetical protein
MALSSPSSLTGFLCLRSGSIARTSRRQLYLFLGHDSKPVKIQYPSHSPTRQHQLAPTIFDCFINNRFGQKILVVSFILFFRRSCFHVGSSAIILRVEKLNEPNLFASSTVWYFAFCLVLLLFCCFIRHSICVWVRYHGSRMAIGLTRSRSQRKGNHCHASSRYFLRRGTHATRNILYTRPSRQMLVILGGSLKFPSVNTQMGLFIFCR